MVASDVNIEIAPLRVETFDQAKFPASVPLLGLLFTPNRLSDIAVNFKIHQPMHSILLSETTNQVVAVLKGTSNQISSDTNIQGTVFAAGEDVNKGGHDQNDRLLY
jgi:hypothetical protein